MLFFGLRLLCLPQRVGGLKFNFARILVRAPIDGPGFRTAYQNYTKNSSSSKRPNLVIRVSFNACLRPPEQPNAPLKPEANTLDIVFPQTRTPLQRVFQHMFYAPPGDMAVNSAEFHIRSKYRIHQHGTLVDDELEPSSTDILCVAQSDSFRTVRTWSQSSTHSNDACPTLSWAIRLHSFFAGSGSLAAWRSCVFPHRDTPTLMDAAQQRNPSVRAVQFRLPPSAPFSLARRDFYRFVRISNCGHTLNTMSTV